MDVAVLGATEHGRAIAGRCALAGHAVRLRDADSNAVMDAVDAVGDRVGPDAAARIDGTTGLDAAVGDADVVIEATDGDPEARRDLLAAAEESVGADAILAPAGARTAVTAVAVGLRRPGRAVGLHVVEPGEGSGTEKRPVVEVVVADGTAESTRRAAVSFAEGLGGEAVVVRDAPGFASDRLELALVAEAVRAVEEGVAAVPDVDRAFRLPRGHPVGPLALADRTGLDRVLASLEDLTNRLGGRFDPPGLLREKVADGELGVSTGTGFYEWENGEPVGPADPSPTIRGRTDREPEGGGPGDPVGSRDR